MVVANFAVLVLTLAVLVWYTIETSKIRQAAVDQVEGMGKPCLTIFATLRAASEAMSEMYGAVGGTVAHGESANFIVQNIGTGVALNVSYYFKALNSSEAHAGHPRYFLNVLQGEKLRMPEPMNTSTYSGECEVVFKFESIGGRHYQSTVTMNNHVLTGFQLKTVKV